MIYRIIRSIRNVAVFGGALAFLALFTDSDVAVFAVVGCAIVAVVSSALIRAYEAFLAWLSAPLSAMRFVERDADRTY